MTWPTQRLGHITRRIGGGTPSRQDKSYWGGGIPWFTVADLLDTDDVQTLTASRDTISSSALNGSAAKLIPEGAVVFSSRVVVGKVGIARNPLATNQDFCSFVPSKELDPEFLAYFLIKTKTDLRSHQRGATIKGVTTHVLDSLVVPVPAISEQRRIVDRIKECMVRANEIEWLTETVRQEAMNLPVALRFDLWKGCIESYELIELGSIVASTKNGLYKPREFHGSGSILLRMFNINGADFDVSRLERVNVTTKEAGDYSIKNEDIIVSRVNSRDLVGKSTVVRGLNEAAVFEAMLIRLRVDTRKTRSDVLTWLMNAPQFLHSLRMRAKHAIGQSSINQRDLLESMLPLPPLAAQEAVSERCSALRDFAASLKRECDSQWQATEGLRESILRKAFAGEL